MIKMMIIKVVVSMVVSFCASVIATLNTKKLERVKEADQLRHACMKIGPVSPAEISDDFREKNVTTAAKAHALTGRRVLTDTPPSMVIAMVPPLPALRRRTLRAARRSSILAESRVTET
jgi:hypothetical protein